MEIKIFSRWDDNKIILCGEYKSIKDCLQKNRGADLRGADLYGADLYGTNLRGADLRGADLYGANLRGANLYWADLYGTNLRGAKTTKRYIQISCIGSRKDQTTYCFEDDLIYCVCWKGTLKKFEERVKETHKDNKQYLAEYLGFIRYIEELARKVG